MSHDFFTPSTGDQWARQHVCCSASQQLWRGSDPWEFIALLRPLTERQQCGAKPLVMVCNRSQTDIGLWWIVLMLKAQLGICYPYAARAAQIIIWLKEGKGAQYCKEIHIDKYCKTQSGSHSPFGRCYKGSVSPSLFLLLSTEVKFCDYPHQKILFCGLLKKIGAIF